MELAFETPKLREICEDKAAGECALGTLKAIELQQCLADLVVAESIADLPDQPEVLSDNSFRITTLSGLVLIFTANHKRTIPLRDQYRVRRLKILSINNE